MPTENKQVPFEREERYIVLKLKQLPKDEVEYLLDCHPKAIVECVVVEHDWPEYHLVWAMIEHRMAGKPVPNFNDWRRADELQQRLTAADERWRELVSAVRSINRSPQYKVMAIDDDEPQYRQRKEWIDWVLGLCDAPAALGEIDLTPKRLAHAESVIEQQNNLIASLRAELVESYRVSAMPQAEPAQEDRETLIGYGRSSGLDEASTLCTRLAYAAYYPPGTRFKAFTPKAQKALGDLLIKAANEIASLPGGPYERFKARQAKKAQSAESR